MCVCRGRYYIAIVVRGECLVLVELTARCNQCHHLGRCAAPTCEGAEVMIRPKYHTATAGRPRPNSCKAGPGDTQGGGVLAMVLCGL